MHLNEADVWQFPSDPLGELLGALVSIELAPVSGVDRTDVDAAIQRAGNESPAVRAEWIAKLGAMERKLCQAALKLQSRAGRDFDYAAEAERAEAAGDAERRKWAQTMFAWKTGEEQRQAIETAALQRAVHAALTYLGGSGGPG